MKAILSHTRAIDEKYNCTSVKFMHRFADFLEKRVSTSLATKIRKYTTYNIHSPVCSIIAGKKPELLPMPQYGSVLFNRYQANIEEMKRFQEISINYLEKLPSFREKLLIETHCCINKLFGKTEYEILEKQKLESLKEFEKSLLTDVYAEVSETLSTIDKEYINKILEEKKC